MQYILLYVLYLSARYWNFESLQPWLFNLNRIVDINLKCRKRYASYSLLNHFFSTITFCSKLILLLFHDRVWPTCHLVTNHVTDRPLSLNQQKNKSMFYKNTDFFHCEYVTKKDKMPCGQWQMSYFEAYVLVNTIQMCSTWYLIAKYSSQSHISYKYWAKNLGDCVLQLTIIVDQKQQIKFPYSFS